MIKTSQNSLHQAVLLWEQGDKKKAGAMIDDLLKQDFTNREIWQFLHYTTRSSKTLEVFQQSFSQKYYPEYAYLLTAKSSGVHVPTKSLKLPPENSLEKQPDDNHSSTTARNLLEQTKGNVKSRTKHFKDEQAPQLLSQFNTTSNKIKQKSQEAWLTTKEQTGPLYQKAQSQVKEKAPGIIASLSDFSKSAFAAILLALGVIVGFLGTMVGVIFSAIMRNPLLIYYWVHAILNPIIILSLWGKASISEEIFWGWIIFASIIDANVRTTMLWLIKQAWSVGAAGLSLGVFGLLFAILAIYVISSIALTISLGILWFYSLYMVVTLTME